MKFYFFPENRPFRCNFVHIMPISGNIVRLSTFNTLSVVLERYLHIQNVHKHLICNVAIFIQISFAVLEITWHNNPLGSVWNNFPLWLWNQSESQLFIIRWLNQEKLMFFNVRKQTNFCHKLTSTGPPWWTEIRLCIRKNILFQKSIP